MQKVTWNFNGILHSNKYSKDSFLSPHSDSIESHWQYIVLWFWHKHNFDFCVPWFTTEHISEEGRANGNMYWRVYYAPVSVTPTHPFHLCFFLNPSLDIYVSYFCMSFNIYWGQVQCTKRWMHAFLQIIIDKFPIAICLNYR